MSVISSSGNSQTSLELEFVRCLPVIINPECSFCPSIIQKHFLQLWILRMVLFFCQEPKSSKQNFMAAVRNFLIIERYRPHLLDSSYLFTHSNSCKIRWKHGMGVMIVPPLSVQNHIGTSQLKGVLLAIKHAIIKQPKFQLGKVIF